MKENKWFKKTTESSGGNRSGSDPGRRAYFSIHSARTNGFRASAPRLPARGGKYETSLFLPVADTRSLSPLSGPCADAWLYLCTHNYVRRVMDGGGGKKSPGCTADIEVSLQGRRGVRRPCLTPPISPLPFINT